MKETYFFIAEKWASKVLENYSFPYLQIFTWNTRLGCRMHVIIDNFFLSETFVSLGFAKTWK